MSGESERKHEALESCVRDTVRDAQRAGKPVKEADVRRDFTRIAERQDRQDAEQRGKR